ncbi:hypothetical protein [Phytoactinopolyspora endophytica]|uniref:hypothetical protein n=1 Tax=Phytoactinopolyspora endophytica TaxID=1642495 RepID=UPI00101DE793|nr:hypothetical protein [Phytoactinopolyspora endophytica]
MTENATYDTYQVKVTLAAQDAAENYYDRNGAPADLLSIRVGFTDVAVSEFSSDISRRSPIDAVRTAAERVIEKFSGESAQEEIAENLTFRPKQEYPTPRRAEDEPVDADESVDAGESVDADESVDNGG